MEGTLSGVAAKVRPIESRDIDAVLKIQRQSHDASQWSRDDYETFVRDAAPCFVAENEGWIAGFLAARKLADEMEILNLAIAPAVRRQGIATQLLCEAMKWASEHGIARVHLEVRASNSAARNFYDSRGFRAACMRPNYYHDPVEDALLLTASVNIA